MLIACTSLPSTFVNSPRCHVQDEATPGGATGVEGPEDRMALSQSKASCTRHRLSAPRVIDLHGATAGELADRRPNASMLASLRAVRVQVPRSSLRATARVM